MAKRKRSSNADGAGEHDDEQEDHHERDDHDKTAKVMLSVVVSPQESKTKKRERWTKEQKREAKTARQANEGEKSSSPESTKEPPPPPPLSHEERLIECATKSTFTQSIFIRSEPKTAIEGEKNNVVKVMTCSNLGSFQQESQREARDERSTMAAKQSSFSLTTIGVKPLLIFDLNGILCHRVRRNEVDPHPRIRFRPSMGNVAMTRVIPRPGGIHNFLMQLASRFTLAVWTSAKRKTTRGLMKLLMPPSVQEGLLFFWTQSECEKLPPPTVNQGDETTLPKPKEQPKELQRKHQQETSTSEAKNSEPSGPLSTESISNSKKPNSKEENNKKDNNGGAKDPFSSPKPIFVKSLSKVWEKYPIFNSSNTLLIDDSLEKCPPSLQFNTIHPPPLNGKLTIQSLQQQLQQEEQKEQERKRQPRCMPDDNPMKNDDVNVQFQETFFSQLAQHFEQERLTYSTEEDDDAKDDKSPNAQVQSKRQLQEFLSQHAVKHMGWRGPYNGTETKTDSSIKQS